MILTRTIALCLRIGELAFAAVVAGLIGKYLHYWDKINAWPEKRFIYTEVVAGLAILASLILLIPLTEHIIHFPLDFILFILWIVAFALLVSFLGGSCGSIWHWGDITDKGTCQEWKASIAFSFLSAIFWLASAILGLWVWHRYRTGTASAAPLGTTHRRRRWYSRHTV